MKKAVILISMILIAISSQAQDIEAITNKVKDGYNFWLKTPEATGDTIHKKPLVVFLHGASLSGTNLNRVLRYGTMDALRKGLDLDAYVIAPQSPKGSWQPKKVMNVVDYVIDKHHDIDTTRIYLLGMSLGGYGTIDTAAAYPDRIAAAIAICGGGSMGRYANLNMLPLWIIHGTADRAVPISQSDNVVAAMKADDPSLPRLRYTRVAGMNHSQPARLFYHPKIYEWLFSHSLDDADRPVAEDFPVNNAALKNVYTNLAKHPKITLHPTAHQ